MALKLQHTETTAAQGCLKCGKSGKSKGGGGRGGAPTRNTFPPGTLPPKSSVCLSFWENPENYHFLPKPQKQTDAGTERGCGGVGGLPTFTPIRRHRRRCSILALLIAAADSSSRPPTLIRKVAAAYCGADKCSRIRIPLLMASLVTL